MATTSYNVDSARRAAALLQIINEKITAGLVEKAIESIRPQIKEQVESIVKELEPRVRSYIDHAGMELVVQLLFNDPTRK